jgi:hypothetical protein
MRQILKSLAISEDKDRCSALEWKDPSFHPSVGFTPESGRDSTSGRLQVGKVFHTADDYIPLRIYAVDLKKPTSQYPDRLS